VVAGQTKTLDLGPHEYNSDKAQGLVVVLPDKQVQTSYGAPAAGTKQWWSGAGDSYDATLTRSVAIPAGQPATLTFQAHWNIEDCEADACDYAYVEVDDGTGFKAVAGNITKPAEGNGIDGYQPTNVPATFDLSAYAGKTVSLRLHYKTDTAAQGTEPTKPSGLFVDEIKLTSGADTVFSDGAETGANGWTAVGFTVVGATITTAYDQFYIASNRTYTSYDKYLQTGPYNFGWPDRPDWVEHFPYQNGLLVSLWDTQFNDNNETVHPGQGQILPIDANPAPIYNLEGQPWRGRIQTYDAPFGLEKSDSFTLHVNGKPSYIRGQAAVPTFNDVKEYWDPAQPQVGVKVPHVGVKLTVTKQSGTSMTVRVAPVAAAAKQ
jgi:immune inhibitor A